MHEYAVRCYTLSGGREVPEQTGHDLPNSTLYGVFAGRDGYFVIAAQVDDAWKRLAGLVGGDALANDTRFHTPAGRNAHRGEILPIVRAWALAQPSVAACLAALDAVEVPSAKVQRIDEVLADPQIQARGMIVEQDHPVLGRIRMPNLPFRFSDCDTSPTSTAPLLGQHNRSIAADLGYADADIDAMIDDGVLYAEEAAARLATS
jgi:crotonobetainyl-CoA:carnitine CoA-transferase CaiB-like acyl-CoA transferase